MTCAMTCSGHFLAVCLFSLIFVVTAMAVTPPPKPLTLKLRHKFHLRNSTDGYDYYSYLGSKIEGDKSRLKWVASVIKNKSSSSSSIYQQQLALEIILGSPFSDGQYLIDASIGSQKSDQLFLIDSGSDVAWLHCAPCTNCDQQYYDIYDPKMSTDSEIVPWTDDWCEFLDSKEGADGECRYELGYGSGSEVQGYFTLDTISWSDEDGVELFSEKIPIGCVDSSDEEINSDYSGMLPLSTSPISIVSTLYLQSLSYCLVSPGDRDAESTLVFNDTSPGPDMNTYRLHLPRVVPSDTFLYVRVTGISVDDEMLAIPDGTFDIQPNGGGGVILDSGTQLTYLVIDAYTPLKDAFLQKAGRTLKGPRSIYEYCFDVSADYDDPYPVVTFHFEGRPVDLILDSYIRFIDDDTECFSIRPHNKGQVSIIGSMQQQNTKFYFNFMENYIDVTPNMC